MIRRRRIGGDAGIGGGSLYCNLKLRGRIEKAVISDLNPELINLQTIIQPGEP